jgi:hypothetical protein
MGRVRRRWRTHQNEEEGPQSTRKPRRWTTAAPLGFEPARLGFKRFDSNFRWKREEGTHGYIFIDLVCRVRLGSSEIPDWFGWRQRRSSARPRQEEEGAADSGVPPVSDTGERNAWPRLRSGPAHVDARESGETTARFGSAQAKRERRKQASAKRASSRGISKFSLFLFSFLIYICFLNHLNRFWNPNQIKSKPHHTIKQMQQHECIIKYST